MSDIFLTTDKHGPCEDTKMMYIHKQLNPPYLTVFCQPLDMAHEKTKNDVCSHKLESSLSDIILQTNKYGACDVKIIMYAPPNF